MKDAAIYPLPFQQPEEAFHGGIVRAAAHRTHATDQIVTLEEPLVVATGERQPRSEKTTGVRSSRRHRTTSTACIASSRV